jgi:hypothetical protein
MAVTISTAPCARGPATQRCPGCKRLILELLRDRWSYQTTAHERQSEAAVATAMWPTRHISVLAVVSLTVNLIAAYLLLGGGHGSEL